MLLTGKKSGVFEGPGVWSRLKWTRTEPEFQETSIICQKETVHFLKITNMFIRSNDSVPTHRCSLSGWEPGGWRSFHTHRSKRFWEAKCETYFPEQQKMMFSSWKTLRYVPKTWAVQSRSGVFHKLIKPADSEKKKKKRTTFIKSSFEVPAAGIEKISRL